MPSPTRAGRARVAATLATFAAAFVALSLSSYTRNSATWDEPQHLTTGYLALTRHEYRLDPEHPPFARLWAALPLLAFGPLKADTATIDTMPSDAWVSMGQIVFSHRFLYVDHDADRLLYAARFMIVLLGLLLGVLIFSWTREWLGVWPAAMALGFYTLEPNLAAHASLVTTDFGVTCFMFGTLYFLWRTCRHVSPWNVAALVACFVLAILTKFSALILGPIVLLLLLAAVVLSREARRRQAPPAQAPLPETPPPQTAPPQALPTQTPLPARAMTLARAGGILVLLGLTTWLGIWAAYGFRYSPGSSAAWRFHFQDDPVLVARVPTATGLVRWVDGRGLLPNAFSQGFLLGQAKAQRRESFLAGRYSEHGWWYYFPVAFAIKTPVSLLALLVIGGLMYAGRWRRVRPDTLLFLVVPIGVYLTWALATRLNIGLRHILPIYPFVILLATGAATRLMRDAGRRGGLVVGLLALFWLFEVGRVYPHTLAFFNTVIGGPRHGAAYLVDSNLDWGQDLKRLRRWMAARGVSRINLAYFGTADPAYYGIQATHLPGGWVLAPDGQPPQLPGYVAVSETVLSGVYFNEYGRALYRPLQTMTPVAQVGRSIRVYWMERPWW